MIYAIRPAAVEDAAEIARVRVITWQSTYRGLIDQDYLDRMDVAAETTRWRDALANMTPERVWFVAEAWQDGAEPGARSAIVGYRVPGAIVGYAVAGPVSEPDAEYPAEIYAIYILPEAQRGGIGRALVRTAAAALIERGHQAMLINVLRENTPARRFYEALGGRPVREYTRQTPKLTLNEVGYGYDLAELLA